MAELLDPDNPQSLDRGQPAQPEPLRLAEQGSQQIVAIRADDFGERLTGGQAPGQAVLLDPGAITLQPVRPVVLDQPLRSGNRDGVEGGAHRLTDEFQTVEAADRGQDMSGVGALLATRLDQAALAQVLQHDLEQVLIASSGKQTGSELAQHGEVEARIAKLQAEGILQVDPTAHRLGRLPIGQVLEELKDGDQGQAPRGYRQLAASVIQAGEPSYKIPISSRIRISRL